MMKRNFFRYGICGLLTLMILLASLVHLHAQVPITISTKVPYYINANTAVKSDVYEIQDGLLHIQYEDKHGAWKEFQLALLDWKYEQVGTFVMDKTFGLNHYTLDLSVRLPGLETDKNYFCSFLDEGGVKHEWMFKNIPPVKSENLKADILVNPIRVECKKEQGNLAEFYSDIKDGKAPYTINWFVMDQGMVNFLYQPREELVTLEGKGSVIQVDHAPGYYVIMDVTDACGTKARKMVFLDCEEMKKKTNTIFVETISQNNKLNKRN
jgi:hypothetical protein